MRRAVSTPIAADAVPCLQIPVHRGHRFRRIADSVPVIPDSA
jgi:hypothetical protein